MLDMTIFVIKSFGMAIASLMGVPVPLTDDITIYWYDFVVFIFLCFMFIKFLGVVTHNQSVTRKE